MQPTQQDEKREWRAETLERDRRLYYPDAMMVYHHMQEDSLTV